MAILAMAGFLTITIATWQVFGSGKLLCFLPKQFTLAQAAYANKFCERADLSFQRNETYNEKIDAQTVLFGPETTAYNAILLLAGAAFLLGVPIAFGDLLATYVSLTRRSRYKEVSVGQTGLRFIAFYSNRAMVVVSLIFVTIAVKRFTDTQLPFGSSLASGGFLLGDFSAVFGVEAPKDPLVCEMEIKSVVNTQKYNFNCSIVMQPFAAMTRIFVFLVWLVIVPTLMWFGLNTCSYFLLSLFSVRKFILSLPGEAVEVSKKSKEEMHLS